MVYFCIYLKGQKSAHINILTKRCHFHQCNTSSVLHWVSAWIMYSLQWNLKPQSTDPLERTKALNHSYKQEMVMSMICHEGRGGVCDKLKAGLFKSSAVTISFFLQGTPSWSTAAWDSQPRIGTMISPWIIALCSTMAPGGTIIAILLTSMADIWRATTPLMQMESSGHPGPAGNIHSNL